MGVPLLEWVFAQEGMTEAQLVPLMRQLGEALRHLHANCVAHLDVKVNI